MNAKVKMRQDVSFIKSQKLAIADNKRFTVLYKDMHFSICHELIQAESVSFEL